MPWAHEVESLKGHIGSVDASFMRITEKLGCATTLTPAEIAAFITEEKECLKDSEVDVKDAKRRISAAKGPKKPKKEALPKANDSMSEGSASEWGITMIWLTNLGAHWNETYVVI